MRQHCCCAEAVGVWAYGLLMPLVIAFITFAKWSRFSICTHYMLALSALIQLTSCIVTCVGLYIGCQFIMLYCTTSVAFHFCVTRIKGMRCLI